MADDDEKKVQNAAPKLDYDTITDKELVELMKTKANSVLIIDVRDPDPEEGDYIGGNITGSVNVPCFDFVDKLPEIISASNLKERGTVVFYCMSGKAAAPQTYKLYDKARKLLTSDDAKSNDNAKDDEFVKIVSSIKLDADSLNKLKAQKIAVLKGGFHSWINYYKNDANLIRDYDEKYWELAQLSGDDDEGMALYHKNEEQ